MESRFTIHSFIESIWINYIYFYFPRIISDNRLKDFIKKIIFDAYCSINASHKSCNQLQRTIFSLSSYKSFYFIILTLYQFFNKITIFLPFQIRNIVFRFLYAIILFSENLWFFITVEIFFLFIFMIPVVEVIFQFS